MMYYQVNWCDVYGDCYSGTIPGFFTTKEEAQKCAEWHEKHPDPNFNIRCWVNEIDLDNVTDRFIPPMTDEEYNKSIEDYFNPKYDYPEDEE